MTYDLRRLRRHHMIERIPKTHRYQVTDFGFRAALFFTRTHARLYRPGLAQVLPHAPPTDTPLQRHLAKIEAEIGRLGRSTSSQCCEIKPVSIRCREKAFKGIGNSAQRPEVLAAFRTSWRTGVIGLRVPLQAGGGTECRRQTGH